MIDAIVTFPAGAGIVTNMHAVFLGSGSGGRAVVGRAGTMVRPRRVRRIGLHFVATFLGALALFFLRGGGSRWRVSINICGGRKGGGGLGEGIESQRAFGARLRIGDGATGIAGVTGDVERVRIRVRRLVTMMSLLLLTLLWL